MAAGTAGVALLLAGSLPAQGPAITVIPPVKITSGPSGSTTSTGATFGWALRSDVGYTECRLDRLIEGCRGTTRSYSGLSLGPHMFTIVAYSAANAELGRDSRSWTIVAPPPPTTTTTPTTTTAPAPPPPPPPPPTGGTTAKLNVGPVANAGGFVLLDASASTGAVRYRFDLDGNGTFETDCGKDAKAGAIGTFTGVHTLGVQTTSATGATSTASAQLPANGGGKSLPAGVSSALASNVVAGGCDLGDAIAATLAAYNCPTTVQVGVAEAIFPQGAPAAACFERTVQGPNQVYTAPKGQLVLVNGILLQPDSSRSITITTGTVARVTAGGGPGTIEVRRGPHVLVESEWIPIDWNVAKVGTVASPRVHGVFKGLSVPEQQAPLAMAAGAQARFELHPTLFWSVLDKLTSDSTLTVAADNDLGPVTGNYALDFPDIPLGVVALRNLHLAYSQQGSSDVWDGGLKVDLASLQVGGHMRVKDASVDEIGASWDGVPGIGPLGCCVFVTHLDVALGSSFTGGVTFTAGPADLVGKITIVTGGAFQALADGSLHIFGIKLGDSWVHFTSDYFDFGGSIDASFLIFSVDAGVTAELKKDGSWFGLGTGEACVDPLGCVNAAVGASNKAIAACGGITTPLGDLDGGGVFYWSGSADLFTGCSVGKLKSEIGARLLFGGVLSAAPIPVQLKRGLGLALFKVTGTTAPPAVRLKGPGGRTIETPVPARPILDRAHGWFAQTSAAEKATYVEVARPAAGRWTVEALPGSPPIRSVAEGDGLPRRIATGSVSGAGAQRVLHYRVTAPAGVNVSFAERAAHLERELGTATRAKGTLRFSPADGPAGTRTVVAVVTSQGLPVRTETVARFRTAGPVVLPAPRVRLARAGGSLLVRWRPVLGASGYHVRVEVADGRGLLLTAKHSPLRVPRVNGLLAATVKATALSGSQREGHARTARIGPLPSVSAPPAASWASLLRGGAIPIRCLAAGDGVCTVTIAAGGRIVARGSLRARFGARVTVRARATTAGRAWLRSHRSGILRASVLVPGTGLRTVRIRLG